jgi:predicted DNA-binding transcriptional regulator YafY
MPATKNQIKRLEILDELLQFNKWTGEELLDKLNGRIKEFGNTIDKRTLFRDILYLMEEKDAPIHRPVKGDNFYYYREKFSLKDLPLDEEDVSSLKSVINILRQVDNFSIIKEVEAIISKLENRIHTRSAPGKTVVQFETHTFSSGHEHFNNLYDAILAETVLKIDYQPFSEVKPSEKIVHPYLLKEYRNRWFLFGREGNNSRLSIYALDRIRKIKNSNHEYIENDLFEPATYFNNLIGVSVNYGDKPQLIEIKVSKQAAPYIKTKPIHHKQKSLKENKDGSLIVQLELFINPELKSNLLSFGDRLQVMKPASLKLEMKELIGRMNSYY